MSIKDIVQNQLRSVIQWENPQDEDLFYQWIQAGDEIKNISKLIVGPGQGCIIVYEGKVQEVLMQEGLYDVKTDNIPFITTLKKALQLLENSEHIVGIYFFRKGLILNRKYGTPAPIVYQDPVYKFPVGLRAFGNYSFRITDPKLFFQNIVIGSDTYSVDQIQVAINSRMSQPFADYLANSKYSYADIDSNREAIVAQLVERIIPIFQKLGFEIDDFRIEGTSFDKETQVRIATISDVAADVHAAKIAGLDYVGMQQMHALRDAAKNESGAAGVGAGLGAGMALGNIMTNAIGQPKSLPSLSAVEKLEQLKALLDKGLITQDEYNVKKATFLNDL